VGAPAFAPGVSIFVEISDQIRNSAVYFGTIWVRHAAAGWVFLKSYKKKPNHTV
jgi:hypothetical protein